MQKRIPLLLLAISLSIFEACNNDTGHENAGPDSAKTALKDTVGRMPETKDVTAGSESALPSKNILENVMSSQDHTTLAATINAAGLAEILKGPGPFTLFAPTNDAFSKLPGGTIDSLLKPGMKKDLTDFLTYHLVPVALKASDLKDGQKLKTMRGEELTVSVKNGKVMINGANVIIPGINSSNGVTYVVDAVLLPARE